MRPAPRRAFSCGLLLAALTCILPARAAEGGSGVMAGSSLQLGPAVGPFSEAVSVGFGAQGFVVVPAPQKSHLGLRVDGGLLSYGSTNGSYIDPTGQYGYAFTVTNNLAMLGLGPQYSATSGSVRPYFYGTLGLGYFYTSTSATDIYGYSGTLNTGQGSSSFSFSTALGGGVRIPVSRRRHTVSIDLGLEWRGHGQAQYLTSSDVHVDSTQSLYFTPRHGRADLLLFRAGVTVEPR